MFHDPLTHVPHVSNLKLYFVDQAAKAKVDDIPHPSVHPRAPHPPENRRAMLRVVPDRARKGNEGKYCIAFFIIFLLTQSHMKVLSLLRM